MTQQDVVFLKIVVLEPSVEQKVGVSWSDCPVIAPDDQPIVL
jgi:hypothetical protein